MLALLNLKKKKHPGGVRQDENMPLFSQDLGSDTYNCRSGHNQEEDQWSSRDHVCHWAQKCQADSIASLSKGSDIRCPFIVDAKLDSDQVKDWLWVVQIRDCKRCSL